MTNSDKQKLYTLAKRIKKAGKVIASDSISKDYHLMGVGEKDDIIITSDSGYETITIGNIYTGNSRGFMCLYSNSTSIRNSFLDIKTIAALLEKVVNEKLLEVGNGKAVYHFCGEYGNVDEQLKYFSEIVCKIAGITSTCNV